MPYPFALPTISSVNLASFFECPSHPSLLFHATTQRSILRDVLKRHKRLARDLQSSNLPTVQDALESYLRHLTVLIQALNGTGDRVIHLTPTRDFESEWRSTLSATIAGREPPRSKITSLPDEYIFVLETLAYVYTNLSRSHLLPVYTDTSLEVEQRSANVVRAMHQLVSAQSIHTLSSTISSSGTKSTPIDVLNPTTSALSALALSEATLLVITKDDPYAIAVAKSRDKTSKDWMISAPEIPQVRIHLYTRLAIAAVDHASKATSLLSSSSGSDSNRAKVVDGSLLRYVDFLHRTARARAMRFQAIDAEANSDTGKAIAWLQGARRILDIDGPHTKTRGFKGLKHSFSERREDARLGMLSKSDAAVGGGAGGAHRSGGSAGNSSDTWGLDAGRLEEGRIVSWLEALFVKRNDTVDYQLIPPYEPLIAGLPSGREYHSVKTYVPPALEREALDGMRGALPASAAGNRFEEIEEDSEDEGVAGHFRHLDIGLQRTGHEKAGQFGAGQGKEPVGAFPGTAARYGHDDGYY